MRLLSEVASGALHLVWCQRPVLIEYLGVEFFHEREILHGDLCDVSCIWGLLDVPLHAALPQKNILINRDGKAIVCGFDLSEFSKVRWSI